MIGMKVGIGRTKFVVAFLILTHHAIGKVSGYVEITNQVSVESQEEYEIVNDGVKSTQPYSKRTFLTGETYAYKEIDEGDYKFKIQVGGYSYWLGNSAKVIELEAPATLKEVSVTKGPKDDLIHFDLDGLTSKTNGKAELVILNDQNQRLYVSGDKQQEFDLTRVFTGDVFRVVLGSRVFLFQFSDLDEYVDPLLLLDSDNDGTVDSEDNCPDKPCFKGEECNDGCPTEAFLIEWWMYALGGLFVGSIITGVGFIMYRKKHEGNQLREKNHRPSYFIRKGKTLLDELCNQLSIDKEGLWEQSQQDIMGLGYNLDNGVFEKSSDDETDKYGEQEWLVIIHEREAPKGFRYEEFKEKSLSNFATNQGVNKEILFLLNQELIGCSLKEWDAKVDQKGKLIERLRGQEFLLPKEPWVVGSLYDSNKTKTVQNGKKNTNRSGQGNDDLRSIKTKQDRILDGLQPLGKLANIESLLTSIKEQVNKPPTHEGSKKKDREKVAKRDLSFLYDYARNCLEYLDICQRAVDSAEKIHEREKWSHVEGATSVLGNLLLNYYQRTRSIPLNEWRRALQVIKSGQGKSQILEKILEQLTSEQDMKRAVKRNFIEEIVYTYCNQVLVLTHAISRLDHFGIHNQGLIQMWNEFETFQNEIQDGTIRTEVKEFVVVKLGDNYQDLHGRVDEVERDLSAAYRSIDGLKGKDVQEIISFGLKSEFFNKEKTHVILA